MNYNNIICFDFETTGINASTAQPVQLAAIAIDARRLEIIPNSEFSVLIKPLYGEECAKAGLEELSDGAIRVHKKTHEILAKDGVSLESAMSNFCSYVNQYNAKKTKWTSPIASGYNINGYDIPILKRDFAKLKLDYPFHPIYTIDILQLMFLFFENDKSVSSLSADSLIRKHMGYTDKGQAHDAASDVIMTAELMIKSMRLIRNTTSKVKFEGCFA